MNTVGDEHHADPLLLQAAHHRKQALTFMLIQRRGGFIQNQKPAMVRQRAGQQNLLFLRQGTAVDGATHIERNIQLGQGLARLLAHCAPAKAQPRLRQTIQHNVFRNGQAGHQRHIDFLLHQMNAQLFRIPRRANAHRLIIDDNLALIMGVRSAQHRHQRRFPRPVSTGQRVYRPSPQGERHIAQRPETGKGQINVVHLKTIRCHPPGPLRLIF